MDRFEMKEIGDDVVRLGPSVGSSPDGLILAEFERGSATRGYEPGTRVWRTGDPNGAFAGQAYDYLVVGELPEYEQTAEDPVCKVKLFLNSSRFAYYAFAATTYDGIDGPVLSGFCVSPLGPDCDEIGDTALAEIAGVRVMGLPAERDLSFSAACVSEIRRRVSEGETP